MEPTAAARGEGRAPYRILSLDGGGIRGALTARLVQRIEQACPGFVSRIDLIAGTSSGSMVGAGLAKGLDPAQVLDVFVKTGPLIFKKTFMRQVLGIMGVLSAQYGTKNRRDAIRGAIGDITLGELSKRVLFTSFELDSTNKLAPSNVQPRSWKPKLFHNYPGPDSDAAASAVDVVLRSSAAPTYFPIYQGFVDGGVIANNPSMCGLAQAMHPEGGGQALDDLTLLSIGVGLTPRIMKSLFGNFGFLQWGIRLFDVIADGGVGLPDYHCQQILGNRYCRINPVSHKDLRIDDPNGVNALIALADSVPLDPIIDWVKLNWMLAPAR